MSTQTSALPDGTTLTKPAASERVSLSVINTNTDNIANNIIGLNSKIIRSANTNITGVSGANTSAFVVALMAKLNTEYSLSGLSIGDVISGRAEWSGVDYTHFTATKMTNTNWNVEVIAARHVITAYYNASTQTNTTCNDLYDHFDLLSSHDIIPMPNARIPDNSDFNNYSTPGVYMVVSDVSAATMTNIPRAASGKLIVFLRTSDIYFTQIYIPTTAINRIYMRNNNNGNWANWDELATKSDVETNWTSCSNYKASIESSANVVMQMFGKVRMLTFQGVGRTHTEDELLMTLPAEHRPIASTNVYSAGNISSTPVTVRLNGTDGRVTLFIANGTTANARLYFQMVWVAA